MWLAKIQKKYSPVDWSEQAVFSETENKETEDRYWRMPEITACSNSQRMTNRKNIRIGKPVGVFANGRSAHRAKVCRRIMRRQTAMAQRRGILPFHFRRHSFIPRVRTLWAFKQSPNQRPDSAATQCCGCHEADLHFRAVRAVTDLTKGNHWTVNSLTMLQSYDGATNLSRIPINVTAS